MCSVGFNNSFGMNIRSPQELQKKQFGANIRNSGQSNQTSFNPDTSIFRLNSAQKKGNPFSNTSLNSGDMMQQVRKQKAAALWDKADAEIMKLYNSGSGGVKSRRTAKGDVKNTTQTTHRVRTANNRGVQAENTVNEVKNADTKPKLTDVLSSLKDLGSAAKSLVSLFSGNKKAAETKEKSAETNVNQSNQQLQNDKQQLEQNKSSLEEANTRVSNAETRLSNATNGVSSAEQKLAAAKAAATEDNPNTAAIQQAEAELQQAKTEEQAAQQELQAAKEEQAQAKSQVESQEQQVQKSEQQSNQSEVELNEAKEEVSEANNQVQQNGAENEKIESGIAEGEQKLSDIENNQEQVDTQEEIAQPNPNPNPNVTELPAEQNIPNGDDVKVEDTVNGDLPVDGDPSVQPKQDTTESDSVSNSNPPSVKDRALKEQNGQYTVNGYVVSKEQFELAKGMDDEVLQAGFTATSDCELVLEDGTSKNFFVHNGKYSIDGKEVDAKQFMAEYNEMKAQARSSARIEPYNYCKENEDGTMTLPIPFGETTIDSSGNVLKETRKYGGVNGGNVTFDARTKTKTTDIDSMKGSRTNTVAVMQDMVKNGSVIQDKDGNVVATYKDGEFFDAKGKKMKDNGIEKLLDKNKGQGLKLVGKLKTSKAGAWV